MQRVIFSPLKATWPGQCICPPLASTPSLDLETVLAAPGKAIQQRNPPSLVQGFNGQTWIRIYTSSLKCRCWIGYLRIVFFYLSTHSFNWDWQSWHADRELLIFLWISICKTHDIKLLCQHCSSQCFYPMDHTVFLHCIFSILVSIPGIAILGSIFCFFLLSI